MKKFVETYYDIASKKIGRDWDKGKIVMLSDMHDNSYGISLEELYRRILMIRPDFIVIAGDMYHGEPGCDNKNAKAFLERLSRKFPIYYGLGNHEYRLMLYPEKYGTMYAEFEQMTKRCGIHLLRNESLEIKKGTSTLVINGLMIDRTFYKKWKRMPMPEFYMKKMMKEPQKDKFQILIAHHPVYFQNYADWGADLVFSGHVHGGMARIPLIGGVVAPNYRLFPKYDKGEYQIGTSTMILSAGIGTHTINLRPLNPPEMVVVTLHADGAE